MRRAALEAFSTATAVPVLNFLSLQLPSVLGDSDRLVRLSAALVPRLNAGQRSQLESGLGDVRGRLWFYLGLLQRSGEQSSAAARVAVQVLVDPASGLELRREAVRVLQLSLGDTGPVKDRPVMYDSYGPRKSLESLERDLNPLLPRLASVFPTGDLVLDRELIRVFAMVAPAESRDF